MKISEKSWHYRLATVYGPLAHYDIRDGISFCWYFWAVMLGLSLAVIVVIACTILCTMFIMMPIIYLASSMFELGVRAPDLFIIFIVVSEILVATAFYFVHRQSSDNPIDFSDIQQKLTAATPGFFTLAYRKFKDKTCFIVSTVD